jgi:DNA-3-methyladenine glycosylase
MAPGPRMASAVAKERRLRHRDRDCRALTSVGVGKVTRTRRPSGMHQPVRRATIRRMPRRLTRSFFQRETLVVARELVGARLVRVERGGLRSSGLIIEAEAYIGSEDLGCHARAGRTTRNASMWGPPGHAYVYFTYGMHWCLNIVTEADGFPAAVLLRALLPTEGTARMRRRRAAAGATDLAGGPAKLCQALGIDRRFDGHDLCSPQASLFLEAGRPVADEDVTCGPRIGLNYVPEPWRSKPWRFRVQPSALAALRPAGRAQPSHRKGSA